MTYKDMQKGTSSKSFWSSRCFLVPACTCGYVCVCVCAHCKLEKVCWVFTGPLSLPHMASKTQLKAWNSYKVCLTDEVCPWARHIGFTVTLPQGWEGTWNTLHLFQHGDRKRESGRKRKQGGREMHRSWPEDLGDKNIFLLGLLTLEQKQSSVHLVSFVQREAEKIAKEGRFM